MEVKGAPPSAAVRAFVAWTLRHGLTLWIAAILLGVPATARTAQLYLHLRSEVEELLPREAPSVQALDEMRARSPGLEFLGVVAKVPSAEQLPGAERFLDDLAARIRAYPPEMVRDVRSSNTAEKDFVEKHAALYTDLADLKEIRRRIEARRDYEVSKEQNQLLDEDEKPPSVDISDIEHKYDDRVSSEKGGHLESKELRAAMLTVEAGGFTTGADKDRALLARVKGDVAALDPEHYVPGMRVGYASDVAINVEEFAALQEDLSVASVLVVLAVVAAIVVYYRWWKSVPVLIPPLLLATVYAFALASLPPLRVTELNSNTAFLGSIIVGNGINVGLILLARYREERARGATVDEALVAGVWGARLGTLAAASAAGVSYASLVLTEFRGFRQFGCIGGIGMLASWATAFVLVPPLLKWLDTGGPAAVRAPRPNSWLFDAVQKLALPIVVVAGLLGIASAVEASRFDASYLENDFNKLRRADTWKNGAGYWSKTMDAILGHYLTPTVLLCDSADEARKAETLTRASADHGVLQPMVARVIGADDVLPTGQEAKIAEANRIRESLTPKIRSLLDARKRDEIDRTLGGDDLAPIQESDLPHAFTTGLRERDGSIGRTLLVYPRPTDLLYHAETIHLFVRTLRGIGAEAAGPGERACRLAGSVPITSDILASIQRDAPIASLASFLGVVVVVLVVLRARKASLYVIASLVLGVLWLLGATMGLGIKLNFTNFIAFPITFGIGVDYSVNVMTRYVQDGERDVRGAVQSTGGAVALCSVTTIIGYSSLLLAKNRALFLFGLLAVLGEIACLTTAIVALPAWLVLTRRVRGAPAGGPNAEDASASSL
jgi:predicted RND superfamily exporter protein